MREANIAQKQDDVRNDHQEKLFKTKFEEFKKKFDNDELKLGGNENLKQIKLANALAYQSRKDFPAKYNKRDQAFFDVAKSVLLVPYELDGERYAIPFHLYMIKNASMNLEKNVAYLRVNFHTPLQFGKDIIVPNYESKQDALFIKEITIKSETGGHNLKDVNLQIREALRLLKVTQSQKDKNPDTREEDLHLANEALIPYKQKKTQLDCLTIRPNIAGKKTIGLLETHKNGFRFSSNKGVKVDFTYANVRSAFFQPCDDDLIVLIHFRLKAPIMIGAKKFLDV